MCSAAGKPADHRDGRTATATATTATTAAAAAADAAETVAAATATKPHKGLGRELKWTAINGPISSKQISTTEPAQDLLLQSMAQWSINVAVVSEPYYVLPRDDWEADLDGSVAVLASVAASTPCLECVHRRLGCVAARLGEIVVVGVCLFPSRTLAELHNSLSELSVVIVGLRSLPVLVFGDFYAKNLALSSRYRSL